jgi:ATP-dependent Clp protease, protease subunit
MNGLNNEVGHQEERWVRFQGGVNAKSATALLRVIDNCYHSGAGRVNLMITSQGGDIFQGQTIFSQLTQIPIKIATYNISTVQSIAVPLFCAGSERYCLPHATFMIHSVNLQLSQPIVLTIPQLRENAARCESSTKSIAMMIASVTGQPVETVCGDMEQTKWFNAEQSQAYGLVHTVVTNLFPAGTGYTVVEEDGTVRDVTRALPQARMSPDIEALLSGKMFPGNGPIKPGNS